MSFFSGSGSKGKDRAGRDPKVKDTGSGPKSQFYVEFLGWMESSGVRGRQYTDPVVQELKRRQNPMSGPPKLTLQLTQKEMKITQDLDDKPKPRSIRKIKFPAILARDITFAAQWRRRPSDRGPEDVVACIYLGYMPRTRRYVHVHVYRFDQPATAATFTRLLHDLIGANADRVLAVERQLAERGEIEDPRLGSSDGMSEGTQHTGTDSAAGSASGSGYSEEGEGGEEEGEEEWEGEEGEGYPPFLEKEVEEDLQSLSEVQPFDNVAEELRHRLTFNDGPLLLPPKDYDTISRARGNLMDINQRRCLSLPLAGGEGEGGTTQEEGGGGGGTLTSEQRQRNVSEESGIDLASPVSDGGDVISRFSSRSGSDSSSSLVAVQCARGSGDTGYDAVYPPRVAHPSRAVLGRQSSQSSLLSNHSSHSSQYSDSGDGAAGAGRRVPVYRRANSANSFPSLPLTALPPPHLSSAPISEDLLPPRDYDDDNEDQLFPRGPVPFRPSAVPAVSPRRASSSDIPSKGSVLTHSLPASALYAEIHRGQVGGVREEGEGVVYNPDRRSQPVYPSPRPW